VGVKKSERPVKKNSAGQPARRALAVAEAASSKKPAAASKSKGKPAHSAGQSGAAGGRAGTSVSHSSAPPSPKDGARERVDRTRDAAAQKAAGNHAPAKDKKDKAAVAKANGKAKEQLITLGKTKGFLTYDDVHEALPGEDVGA
jgi:hypothetical protein